MKFLILTADANTLVYHRGDLIRDIAERGCEIVTSAAEDHPHVRAFVEKLGGRHVPIRMTRSNVSLARDAETMADMWRLMRKEKPDAIFAYTIKSVCYGCVIARLAGVRRVYALLPGMGITFVKADTLKGRIISRISRMLHRNALKRVDAIFVQNPDDLNALRAEGLLPKGVPVHLTAGSGVNLNDFPHVKVSENTALKSGSVRFVLVSRLLKSKGVRIFAEAARALKAKYPQAEFHLVGPFDPNPNRITEEEVAQWVREGTLIHHGMVRDVAAVMRWMHVFVLPTWYREGVPHATLEALSIGRPVVTTDSVGARETVALTERGKEQQSAGADVIEGHNGFLVRPHSVAAASEAMEWFLQHPDKIPVMGRASRKLAEEVFDVRLVNKIIMRAMDLTEDAVPVPQVVAWPRPAVV